MNSQQLIGSAFSLGGTVAVVMSYDKNKSIPWAILHGLCGWFYVAYRFVKDN